MIFLDYFPVYLKPIFSKSNTVVYSIVVLIIRKQFIFTVYQPHHSSNICRSVKKVKLGSLISRQESKHFMKNFEFTLILRWLFSCCCRKVNCSKITKLLRKNRRVELLNDYIDYTFPWNLDSNISHDVSRDGRSVETSR